MPPLHVEVFNGDIGRIIRVDPENQRLQVRFEDRVADYEWVDLEKIFGQAQRRPSPEGNGRQSQRARSYWEAMVCYRLQ
jgi:hypothetical protein